MVTAGMRPQEAVREISRRLAAAGCPDATYDARTLFRLAAGCEAVLAPPLSAQQAKKLEDLAGKRESRVPLQYLCGTWPFLTFTLAVGPGVLCPRADTEVVAQTAAAALQTEHPHVLDLCAGSGCLGLGIKMFCPGAEVCCVEKSEEAMRYLAQNAQHALAQGTVRAVQADVFYYYRTLAPQSLDAIVCNPPYLTAQEMHMLQPEVLQEPAMALAAGKDGLDFYRLLAEHYQECLVPDGLMALEIGWQQKEAVTALLAGCGWRQITCVKDYGGNDRCITARRPQNITTNSCNNPLHRV